MLRCVRRGGWAVKMGKFGCYIIIKGPEFFHRSPVILPLFIVYPSDFILSATVVFMLLTFEILQCSIYSYAYYASYLEPHGVYRISRNLGVTFTETRYLQERPLCYS